MISKLPCNHLFNTDAILKWLKEEKAECPICRFKLESTEKKLERSDSSNNTVQDRSRILRPRIPGTNTRLMRAFGPPRMPRRGHNAHLRRLMLSRHEQEEQEELQAALLASLEDQYMPGQPKTHKEDASDTGSDANDMGSDANMGSDVNDMGSDANDMGSDISDMDFDTSDMDFDTSDMDSDTNDMDAID